MTTLIDHVAEIETMLTDWSVDYTLSTGDDDYTVTAGDRTAQVFTDQDGCVITTISGDVPPAGWLEGEMTPEEVAIALGRGSAVAATVDHICDAAREYLGQPVEPAYWGGVLECVVDVAGGRVTVGVAPDGSARLTEHPLDVTMHEAKDLEAIIEAAGYAYANKGEAWGAMCSATDFEHMAWEDIVATLHPDVAQDHNAPLTLVRDTYSDTAALVEDHDGDDAHWVVTNLDRLSLGRTISWTHQETAAATLAIID